MDVFDRFSYLQLKEVVVVESQLIDPLF